MKIINKNSIKILSFLFIFLVSVSVVFAQSGACDPQTQICNPIAAGSIKGLIRTILIGVIQIGLPVIALAIVYDGFLFVSARGNSEKLKKAKEALFATLIGGAVIMGAWAIAEMISTTVSGLSS